MRKYIQTLPVLSLLLVLNAYFFGALFGGFTSTYLANSLFYSIFPGIMLTLGGIMNAISIPHPLWFVIASFLIYLPVSVFGGCIALQFL